MGAALVVTHITCGVRAAVAAGIGLGAVQAFGPVRSPAPRGCSGTAAELVRPRVVRARALVGCAAFDVDLSSAAITIGRVMVSGAAVVGTRKSAITMWRARRGTVHQSGRGLWDTRCWLTEARTWRQRSGTGALGLHRERNTDKQGMKVEST